MDAARACAALQVTGEQANYALPANTTSNASGSCTAAGTAVTFTTTYTTAGLTNASAIVQTNGSVQMSVCAAMAGVTPGTAPNCV